MLRIVLLIFGWVVPIVVMLTLASQIYLFLTISGSEIAPPKNLGLNIAIKIAYSVERLALSPLCFFGAYMIKTRSQS